MAIFDILKKDLFREGCGCSTDKDAIVEEENSVEGDPQALVDAMIEHAPGSKEQIGVILKYAANSIPNYDIWDAALDYYESIGDDDGAGTGDDEIIPTEEEPVDDEEVPVEEPSDDEVSVEEPVEGGDDEDISM